MKAAVYERYGPPEVVEVRDVEKPVPKDGEVLIKIHATTVTSGDWRMRSLELPSGFGFMGPLVFGISKPRQPILGFELAGEIEALGAGVTNFQVGDQVFAFLGASTGCHAEYRCVRADGPVAKKPSNLSYADAAALSFGGATGLHYFRKAGVKAGERVLVNGASGGVGTAMVQLGKHFGAEVTGVCSRSNVELVRSLGADHVIDYAKDDFTKNGVLYDIIVDTVGTAPYSRSKGSLAKGGRLLLVLNDLWDMFSPLASMWSGKKVIAGPASERVDDLRTLAELAEAGKFKPFIDRTYPLEQIVEAHRLVDSGRKRGNVVVTIGSRG